MTLEHLNSYFKEKSFKDFCRGETGCDISRHLKRDFEQKGSKEDFKTLENLVLYTCYSAVNYDVGKDVGYIERMELQNFRLENKIGSQIKAIEKLLEFWRIAPEICKKALMHVEAEVIKKEKGEVPFVESHKIVHNIDKTYERFEFYLRGYSKGLENYPVSLKRNLKDGFGYPFIIAGLLFSTEEPSGVSLEKKLSKIKEQSLFFRLAFIFRYYTSGKMSSIQFSNQPMPSFGKSHYSQVTKIAALALDKSGEGLNESTVSKAINSLEDDKVQIFSLDIK